MRRAAVQALVLLRGRGAVTALPILKSFFALFRVRDKLMREMLFTHIVKDVRSLNASRIDAGTNRAVQAFLFSMLADPSPAAAKRSLDVLIEL